MSKQVKTLSFKNQTIYVGADVHKNTWKVASCTAQMNPTKWPVTIEKPFVENLKDYLDRHFPDAQYICCYEAGFSGFWAQKALEKVGVQTIVVNAADIPTSDKERKQKEDKRDARKIAKALKDETVSGIYIPEDIALRDRDLVRERYSIAKSSRRVKSQIKSHMALYNIEIPEDFVNKHWSARFISWLNQLSKLRDDPTLDLQIERLEMLRQLQLRSNRMLRELGRSQRYNKLYSLLRSIPGIGSITAMVLITEIIDMKRFSNMDQLMSYVGFIPTTKGSGEKTGTGKLTKRCNVRLRCAIIESSWVSIKHDPALMLKYGEFKKRMTGQQAIVRIGRILLRRIRAVWLKQESYKTGVM
jgi:transposase